MKNRQKYFARTSWAVEDVMEYAEQNDYSITEKQAKLLLQENEERIVEAMIATGWDVIADLLNEDEYSNP